MYICRYVKQSARVTMFFFPQRVIFLPQEQHMQVLFSGAKDTSVVAESWLVVSSVNSLECNLELVIYYYVM